MTRFQAAGDMSHEHSEYMDALSPKPTIPHVFPDVALSR